MTSAASISRYRANTKAKSKAQSSSTHFDPIGLRNSSILFQFDLLDFYQDSLEANYAKQVAADKARRLARARQRQQELKQAPARVIHNVKVIKKDPAPKSLQVLETPAPQAPPPKIAQALPAQSAQPVELKPPPVQPKQLPLPKLVPLAAAPVEASKQVVNKVQFQETSDVGLSALAAFLLSVLLLSGAAKYDFRLPSVSNFPFDVTRAMPDRFHASASVEPVRIVVEKPPAPKLVPKVEKAHRALSIGQAAVARYLSKRYRVSADHSAQLVHDAWQIGREEQVEPTLILAIAGIESSYNPTAVSPVGAKGLMQVMDELHQEKFAALSPQGWSPFDPALNLRVGARIIGEYTRRAGSLYEGLIWYVGAALHRNHGGYPDKVLRLKSYIDTAYANGKA